MSTKHELRRSKRGANALNRQHGAIVKLVRCGVASDPFDARRRDVEYSTLGDEMNLDIKIQIRDYDFAFDAVVINGTTVEPEAGDKIVEGTEEFEIQSPKEGVAAVVKITGELERRCHTQRLHGVDVQKMK